MLRRTFDEQIERIKTMQYHWADEGCLPPRAEAISVAEYIVSFWKEKGYASSCIYLSPVEDGTLQLEFSARGAIVEVDIASATSIVVYYCVGNTDDTAYLHSYTKDTVGLLVQTISEFLRF